MRINSNLNNQIRLHEFDVDKRLQQWREYRQITPEKSQEIRQSILSYCIENDLKSIEHDSNWMLKFERQMQNLASQINNIYSVCLSNVFGNVANQKQSFLCLPYISYYKLS